MFEAIVLRMCWALVSKECDKLPSKATVLRVGMVGKECGKLPSKATVLRVGMVGKECDKLLSKATVLRMCWAWLARNVINCQPRQLF